MVKIEPLAEPQRQALEQLPTAVGH